MTATTALIARKNRFRPRRPGRQLRRLYRHGQPHSRAEPRGGGCLATRFRNDDDLDAARQLVLSHLRFVVHIARGYSGYGLPLGDLDPGRQRRPDEGREALRPDGRRASGVVRRALDPRRDPRVRAAQLAPGEGRDDQGAAQAVLQPAQA